MEWWGDREIVISGCSAPLSNSTSLQMTLSKYSVCYCSKLIKHDILIVVVSQSEIFKLIQISTALAKPA